MTTPEQTGGKETAKEDIPLNPETMRAFGNGLDQLLSPLIQEIKSDFDSLSKAGPLHSFALLIQNEIKKFEGKIKGLQKGEQIKLVPVTGINFGWQLDIPIPTESEPPFVEPGTVSIEQPLLRNFCIGFSDALSNNFAMVLGFAEMLTSNLPSAVKYQGVKIHNATKEIYERIKPFTLDAEKIQIDTDDKGLTYIKVIKSNDTRNNHDQTRHT